MGPKSIPGITDRQRQVWETLLRFQQEHDCLPTLKELRVRGTIPCGVLIDRLGALIARGFAERHGKTYKALPPPHLIIIERACESCRVSIATVSGDSKSLASIRARKIITKELRASNYQIGDIALLLKKDRNTIYYYGQPARRAARNAYGKIRRSQVLQAQIGA